MMLIRIFSLFFLLSLSFWGLDAHSKEPDRIEQGERLYNLHCSTCHGFDAEGEDVSKPMGGVRENGVFLAPALNGTGRAWVYPDEMLRQITSKGPLLGNSVMHGFGGLLGDDKIELILEYFKSLWPEPLQRTHAKREQELKSQHTK
ncbi:cytochrome c [Deltaproteobacteria bacterium TL4]